LSFKTWVTILNKNPSVMLMPKRLSILIAVLLTGLHHSTTAQIVKIDSTTHWKKALKVGLNLNQASFTSNWQGGGVNSIGFNTLLHYKTNYEKDGNSWDNEFDFLFGLVNNDGQGNRKTNDRIYLDTKYGRNLSEYWSLFISGNFLTQFAKGYTYKKNAVGVEEATFRSDFLAPAFVTAALGVEYKPADYFNVRISPVAPRLTIVKNIERFVSTENPKPYGVDSTETTRLEWLAAQIVTEFNKDVAKNLNLKLRYVVFANYETFASKTIDHRVDLNFTAKVNNFINVSFGSILLYDYDQDSGAQLSQALSLGFLFSYQNYEDKKK
jgi:hypothetical protein